MPDHVAWDFRIPAASGFEHCGIPLDDIAVGHLTVKTDGAGDPVTMGGQTDHYRNPANGRTEQVTEVGQQLLTDFAVQPDGTTTFTITSKGAVERMTDDRTGRSTDVNVGNQAAAFGIARDGTVTLVDVYADGQDPELDSGNSQFCVSLAAHLG